MKLRHLTLALALLVPATASAGPLQPNAALSNETADLTPSYEAPLTGSQLQLFSAPVTSSQYHYETEFTLTLSKFIENGNENENGNGNGNNNESPRETPLEQQQPHPVPEPSTLLLVGSSLAVAAVRKARAGRKASADVQ